MKVEFVFLVTENLKHYWVSFSLLSSPFSMKGHCVFSVAPLFFETLPDTWKNQLGELQSQPVGAEVNFCPTSPLALLGPLLVPRMLLLPFSFLQERILDRERKESPALNPSLSETQF